MSRVNTVGELGALMLTSFYRRTVKGSTVPKPAGFSAAASLFVQSAWLKPLENRCQFVHKKHLSNTTDQLESSRIVTSTPHSSEKADYWSNLLHFLNLFELSVKKKKKRLNVDSKILIRFDLFGKESHHHRRLFNTTSLFHPLTHIKS